MTEDWIIGFVWANGTQIENPHTHDKFIRIQNKNHELLLKIAVFLGLNMKEMASGLGVIDISHEHPVCKRVIN